MKRITAYLVLILTLLAGGCSKDTDIFCTLTLNATLPDGENAVAIRVDNSLSGNIFRNYNTGMDYEFPLLINGSATVKVQKGVYIIAFDADALMQDGTTRRVRFTLYNSPENAVSILDNEKTLTLELKML